MTDRLANQASGPLSLLWPASYPGDRHEPGRLRAGELADLDLDCLAQALSGQEPQRAGYVREVLAALCPDPDVIAYRAATLSDLQGDATLRQQLQQLLPKLTALRQATDPQAQRWSVDGEMDLLVRRLRDLDLCIETIGRLRDCLGAASRPAPALQALRAWADGVAVAPDFVALQTEVAALREAFEHPESFIVGLNLGPDLQPESGALVAIDAKKVKGASLWARRPGERSARQTLTPLRTVDSTEIVPAGTSMVKLAVFDGRSSPFARDLRALLGRVTCPVREAVDQHLRLLAQVLCTIEPELAFFLQAATLFDRLQAAGLPVCRPVVAPLSERECVLEDCYNLSLALRLLQPASGGPAVDTLVANPVDFEAAQAQVWILTGPNRGGKTVYARAVAQAQVLFQAGLFVPARAGRMSPVDAIYTHFPRHEGRQLGAGRLDDEAERLASIFAHASPHSLILINEALAGTNAIEGLALALDVVRGLRLLGARAVYVTHLLDLAALTDEINAQTPGTARVGSLVSKVEVNRTDGSERRTYRILPGAPRGTSYASTIANQRGISFAQLAALLQSRGVVAALCD